ncbi:hypothetical protein APHAL10511_008314 [Amanita phalloides]|nr:hypothetical protein APHAL10511_008314 [Amanita phalloides]
MQDEPGLSLGSKLKTSLSFIYPVKSLFNGIQPDRRNSVSGNSLFSVKASASCNMVQQESDSRSVTNSCTGTSHSSHSPLTRSYSQPSLKYFCEDPTPPTFLIEPEKIITQMASCATHSSKDASRAQECGVEISPLNPSECGFIHLPPAPTTSPHAIDRVSALCYQNLSRNTPSATQETDDKESRPAQAPEPCPSITPTTSSKSDTKCSTFRFTHKQDKHGHYVITGREGRLQRCEDEPIHAPGTVQAFGALVAIEETEGALLVRQVSENSTSLLGLPPSYLFSLSCFTDTLPDSQACLLWDNIRFLSEPDDDEVNPHVFLLTGWGAPGSALPGEKSPGQEGRRTWTCWCAVHRTDTPSKLPSKPNLGLMIMEFELERDTFSPLYPPVVTNSMSRRGSTSTDESDRTLFPTDDGARIGQAFVERPSSRPERLEKNSSLSSKQVDWTPKTEDILQSTTCYAKPLTALERVRRASRLGTISSNPRRPHHSPARGIGGMGMMDMFAVMTQINEQFDAAPDLDMLLKVVVGIIKDLTQFHRVLIYQFDEVWNGKVVTELVDGSQTHELYHGLHFPASDIPAQVRQLYAINKVRLLYDRGQPTARLIVKSNEDLRTPLNMTHCFLRSMSPVHLKYLENMGVRASMSLSILVFGQLWGLVTCHGYGEHGMRVSFPIRQMLRLLSQAISRNVERISYAQRLRAKKLMNSIVSDRQHSEYIISNVDDLLSLFDADFGILVISEGAKILGPDKYGQEILIMAEYLRLKQFTSIQASQAVTSDYPDLKLTTGLEVIAGLLYVPLSNSGRDFIAFLRKGQKYDVRWAGRPYKDSTTERSSVLEPRKSFRVWSETVVGRCRAWTEQQLETAGVLSLVYCKFIEVWRYKENANRTKKLTSLLLSNASHEVRTPLNHIINYLEMALNGSLPEETRANLSQTHTASKSLLFTINDLLDLTRLETGNETSFNEPFDFHTTIEEATCLYRQEAERRRIDFQVDFGNSPKMVVGDGKKIKTVVQNLTANALKYTAAGSISVCCIAREDSGVTQKSKGTTVETVVTDTGCGIATSKLETIFREFEQVEPSESRSNSETGVGLGLAVVARNVDQLGGQLRVESKVGEGSRFTFSIPLSLPGNSDPEKSQTTSSLDEGDRDIRALFNAFSFDKDASDIIKNTPGMARGHDHSLGQFPTEPPASTPAKAAHQETLQPPQLRILVVEDNDINRAILTKRLRLNGHVVANVGNGQECLAYIEADQAFDAILMDIQMPLLNGFETAQRIRDFEKKQTSAEGDGPQCRRRSHILNRIPIFAVSASLVEKQRMELLNYGLDGWILKPIDFKRLKILLHGVTDPIQRQRDVYYPGFDWENGGWLK